MAKSNVAIVVDSTADLPADGSRTTLKVIGTAWAGRPYHGSAKEKQCVRIMTGAKMPDGLDTVIMQEQVECVDDTILIGSGHKPGQNVRQAGGTGMCEWPGRVLPGHPMAGQYGNKRETKKNLTVVRVDAERNLLLVKGSVPGSKNGLVFIRVSG